MLSEGMNYFYVLQGQFISARSDAPGL